MYNVQPRILQVYIDPNGRSPFTKWLESLDRVVRSIIDNRLIRVQKGSLGDYKSLKDGVFELRIQIGYRVYFAMIGTTILLLCGGTKSTQSRDIRRAKTYWKEYQGASK